MCYGWSLFFILPILCYVLADEKKYDVSITQLSPCENFENDKVKSNVTQELCTVDDQQRMAMAGFIEVLKGYKIVKGHQMELQIMKEDENGKEPVMGMKTDFCETFEKEHMPHIPVFKEIGIEGCPVDPGKYPFPEGKPLYVDMSPLSNFMCEENVGCYTVKLTISDPQNPDPNHPDICYEVGCVIQEILED